jgi:hypothetical protein
MDAVYGARSFGVQPSRKAGPTEYTHALGGTGWTANCRTGFSREEASVGALDFAV